VHARAARIAEAVDDGVDGLALVSAAESKTLAGKGDPRERKKSSVPYAWYRASVSMADGGLMSRTCMALTPLEMSHTPTCASRASAAFGRESMRGRD
jgi:hypothetical protein